MPPSSAARWRRERPPARVRARSTGPAPAARPRERSSGDRARATLGVASHPCCRPADGARARRRHPRLRRGSWPARACRAPKRSPRQSPADRPSGGWPRSQSGASCSRSAQNACSESVSPIRRKRCVGKRSSSSMPVSMPLWANTWACPPSSRVNGCVLRRSLGPCVALRMCAITVELRISSLPHERQEVTVARRLGLAEEKGVALLHEATPQPSRCGPLSPPWRASSSRDRRTLVGRRAVSASSSHTAGPLRWSTRSMSVGQKGPGSTSLRIVTHRVSRPPGRHEPKPKPVARTRLWPESSFSGRACRGTRRR